MALGPPDRATDPTPLYYRLESILRGAISSNLEILTAVQAVLPLVASSPIEILALFPTIIAAYWRLLHGQSREVWNKESTEVDP